MPIATSTQKDQVSEFQHLLPKPPRYGRRLSPSESVVSDASELVELAEFHQQYGILANPCPAECLIWSCNCVWGI